MRLTYLPLALPLLLGVGCKGSLSDSDTGTSTGTATTTAGTDSVGTTGSSAGTDSATGSTTVPTSTTSPTSTSSTTSSSSGSSTGPSATCGDNVVDAGEDCDDGNTASDDGCSEACIDETAACVPATVGVYEGMYSGVALRGVVDANYLYYTGFDRLVIVDVTDENLPSFAGTFKHDPNNYPNAQTLGIAKRNDHVFVGGSDPQISSISVANPQNPTLSAVRNPFQSNGHVALVGQYLFLADSSAEELRLFDVANPSDLSNATFVGNGNQSVLSNVGLGQEVLFAAAGNRLEVYDIANPWTGTFVSSVLYPASWSPLHKIVATDQTAFVAGCAANTDPPLVIFDASNMTVPTVAAEFDTPVNDLCIHDVALRGDFLYAAVDDGLYVIDVADPAAPVTAAASLVIGEFARMITVDDTHAYLGTEGEVRIIEDLPGMCDATCGNSTVEYPEDCDDGNLAAGDGCTAICESE